MRFVYATGGAPDDLVMSDSRRTLTAGAATILRSGASGSAL